MFFNIAQIAEKSMFLKINKQNRKNILIIRKPEKNQDIITL